MHGISSGVNSCEDNGGKQNMCGCRKKFHGQWFSWVFIVIILDIVGISTIHSTNTKASNNVIMESTPVVSIAQGKLQGVVMYSREGRDYLAYRGIPYAKTPVRFEAPRRMNSWEGIRNASEFGDVCIQQERHTPKVVGSEDCLFINVYTPKLSGRFPIIVYIHGGSLTTGSGNYYGADYFMDQDVILVTLNYRLGALGFLSTGDEEIQGNAGLKDQIMALRWVKENIQYFGGDSNRVTIMGESAGAACVSLLILSPMAKGLFNFAISQSGTALNPWAFNPKPLRQAMDLGDLLNCPLETSQSLAECLRRRKPKDIVQVKLTKWYKDPLVQFNPTAEKLRRGQAVHDVFLTEEPLILLTEGRFNKVPWITGLTEEEGILFHAAYVVRNEELTRDMNENWNRVAPITFIYEDLDLPQEEVDNISRQIRGFYFGDQKVSMSTEKNLTNVYSDSIFNHGVKVAALLQARYSPVYTYILGYHGEYTFLTVYYKNLIGKPIGICHADDLQYFFSTPFFPKFKPYSNSDLFSKALVKMWSSFAATGNVMGSMGTPNVQWLPVSMEEIKRKRLKWYNLDIQPRVILEPFTQRLEFWDKIMEQLRLLKQQTQTQSDLSEKQEDRNNISSEEEEDQSDETRTNSKIEL